MLSEGEIQKAVFDNLRERAMPGVVFWHTPNDRSSRSKAGYRAGVSDVAALYRGMFYVIELKTEKGQPTEEQMRFISEVNAAGGMGCITSGLDQALKALENWGLLRGISS